MPQICLDSLRGCTASGVSSPMNALSSSFHVTGSDWPAVRIVLYFGERSRTRLIFSSFDHTLSGFSVVLKRQEAPFGNASLGGLALRMMSILLSSRPGLPSRNESPFSATNALHLMGFPSKLPSIEASPTNLMFVSPSA